MNLHLTNYTYYNVFAHEKQAVRVYSEERGANGKVVLEDIVHILLTDVISISNLKFDDNDIRDVLTITQEKIELSDISPVKHEGLHLVDVEQLYDFYPFCDDLAKQVIYQNLGDWLNLQVCTLIIKRLAHLGNMVSQVPFWEEYSIKIASLFEKDDKVTIREWLSKCYGLTVPWVITILTNKVKNMMSGAYNVNAGERPDKNEGNVNIYSPKIFGFVAQRIEWWISSDSWVWLKDAINDGITIKKAVDDDKNRVISLRKEGKSDDDIIQIIWEVTPTSNIVQQINYQYDILKAFIKMV